uniref:Uncharacterized protein n=1 Tax=Ditylenchus dipsaci TaxID=166011 RepID=A0A915DLQ4_9BILA
MLAEWKTAHLSYQVTKLFGTNYLSPSSVNYTGPLTRTSTMETCELELANRQNYLIVPSYSEAILLDPLMMSSANGVPPIPSIRSEFLSRNEPLTSSNEAAIIANYGSIGYSSYSNNSTDASTSFANTLSQRLFGSKPGSQYQPLNGHRPIRLDNLIEGVSYSANHRHFPLTQEPGLRPSTKRKITKSRSMSFFNSKNPVRRPNPPLSSAAVPLPRPSKLTVNTAANTARDYKNARKPPVRSISISGAISSHVSADNAWSNGQAVVPGGRFESGMDRRPLLFDQCSSNKAGADDPPPSYELALRMCAPLYNRLRQSANSITSLLNQAITRSNSKDLRLQPQNSADAPSSSSNAGYETWTSLNLLAILHKKLFICCHCFCVCIF